LPDVKNFNDMALILRNYGFVLWSNLLLMSETLDL